MSGKRKDEESYGNLAKKENLTEEEHRTVFEEGLEMLLDTSERMLQGPKEVVGKDVTSGLVVSTVLTSDVGYETAIVDKQGAHPVQRYENRDAAVQGHGQWVARAHELVSIKKLGWGSIVENEIVTLMRFEDE